MVMTPRKRTMRLGHTLMPSSHTNGSPTPCAIESLMSHQTTVRIMSTTTTAPITQDIVALVAACSGADALQAVRIASWRRRLARATNRSPNQTMNEVAQGCSSERPRDGQSGSILSHFAKSRVHLVSFAASVGSLPWSLFIHSLRRSTDGEARCTASVLPISKS